MTARLRHDFVVIWKKDGAAFYRFDDAERNRENLLLNSPELFGDTVVSGVFTQKTLSVTGETEKKTMALYFPETTNSSKLFGGRVYWPKSFLEENTN